jgi:hypothetical protein
MLSLDQIIEFYDEHTLSGGTGNRILLSDSSNIRNNNQQQLNDDQVETETEELNPISKLKRIRNPFKKKRANKLRLGKKIYEFYNAPITKFWQNMFMYILFLISFSYIVLVKTPSTPSIPEIFFLIYVFTYGLDKIREVCFCFFFLFLDNFN